MSKIGRISPAFTQASAQSISDNARSQEITVGNPIDKDFVQFCRQATDTQLENILKKEWYAYQHRDYDSAVRASMERGWVVEAGKRLQ